MHDPIIALVAQSGTTMTPLASVVNHCELVVAVLGEAEMLPSEDIAVLSRAIEQVAGAYRAGTPIEILQTDPTPGTLGRAVRVISSAVAAHQRGEDAAALLAAHGSALVAVDHAVGVILDAFRQERVEHQFALMVEAIRDACASLRATAKAVEADLDHPGSRATAARALMLQGDLLRGVGTAVGHRVAMIGERVLGYEQARTRALTIVARKVPVVTKL